MGVSCRQVESLINGAGEENGTVERHWLTVFQTSWRQTDITNCYYFVSFNLFQLSPEKNALHRVRSKVSFFSPLSEMVHTNVTTW